MNSELLILSHSNHFGRKLFKKGELNKLSGNKFNLYFNIETLNGRLETFDDHATDYKSYHSIGRQKSYLIFLKKLIDNIIDNDLTILDIGCNNAELLRLLNTKHKMYRMLGVDPSIKDREGENIFLKKGLFSKKMALDLGNKWKELSIIIARQVLEHVPDLFDFISGINILSSNKTKLIIEVPDFTENLYAGDITTIFCEHIYYLTLPGIDKLFQKHGWYIKKYWRFEYWGGSLLILFTKEKINDLSWDHEKKVLVNLAKDFRNKINSNNERIKNYLNIRRQSLGKGILCYGIGNRALQLFAFSDWLDLIDNFVDSDPSKDGLYIPYNERRIIPIADSTNEIVSYHTIFITGFGYEQQILVYLKKYFQKNNIQVVCMDPYLRFLIL